MHVAFAEFSHHVLGTETQVVAPDEAVKAALKRRVAFEVAQHGEQKRERHHALMAVDERRLRRVYFLRHNQLAEKVSALPFVPAHCAHDIGKQAAHFGRLPSISPLKIGQSEMIRV